MPQPSTIDFNRLPKGSRKRLVDCISGVATPAPILEERLGMGLAVFGWGSLAASSAVAVLLLVGSNYGKLFRGALQAWPFLFVYAALIFLAAFSVISIVRRSHLRKQLPFQPGRYFFPVDIVDAREREIKLLPVGAVADFRGVHHHTNGVYTHTELRFTFEGGKSTVFSVRGKQLAEQKLTELQEARDRLHKAVEARDPEALAALDVFLDARLGDKWDTGFEASPGDGPVAGELPFLSQKRLLLSIAVTVVAAVPTWFVRNRLSDDAAFDRARRSASASSYEDYLTYTNGRHADEVRGTLLPRAALDEAIRAKSATQLRRVIREFPASSVVGEAKAALHQMFVKGLEDFRRHASTEDPRVLKFFEQLLAYEEANDSPVLRVNFQRPKGEVLKATDEFLSKEAKREVAPIAPHFDAAHALPREKSIVDALGHAFKSIVAADILPLRHGEDKGEPDFSYARYHGRRTAGPPEPKPSDKASPTIDVAYVVSWSGSIYEGEKSGRAFVGITVQFAVSMSIPGVPDKLDFTLEVRPPKRFVVDWTSFRSKVDVAKLAEAPPDYRVYEVMALKAFDELEAKLRAVFFSPEFQPPPLPETKPLETDRIKSLRDALRRGTGAPKPGWQP